MVQSGQEISHNRVANVEMRYYQDQEEREHYQNQHTFQDRDRDQEDRQEHEPSTEQEKPKKQKKVRISRVERRLIKARKKAEHDAAVAKRKQERQEAKKRKLEEYQKACLQRQRDEIMYGLEEGELGRPSLHPPRKRIRNVVGLHLDALIIS
jgi:hypothetical protein